MFSFGFAPAPAKHRAFKVKHSALLSPSALNFQPSTLLCHALAITNFCSFFTTARIESRVRRSARLAIEQIFWHHPGMSPSTAAVASSPKLLDRVRWHLRVKHYSVRTEQAYVDWIRRYILFHRKRHPNEMST